MASTTAKDEALTPPEETKRIAGVSVVLTWPSSASKDTPVKGVTFLITGAMVSISEYNGLRDIILEKKHLVVGLFMNPLWPLRNNHRRKAEDVKNVFQELRSSMERDESMQLPDSYSIVGHSMGGKVSLLVASVADPEHVTAVLALDPVDINPVEFTNEDGPNLPLSNDKSKDTSGSDEGHGMTTPTTALSSRHISIVLTCTDGGKGIPKAHNGEAIHKLHPSTTYYRHEHAGHMCYCDHGGGWAGKLMPDVGSPEGNEAARKSAKELIRKLLMDSASGNR
ncbi:MAG: hypothetical protein SGILL_002036 [Bacillariaceae sp.]